MNDHARIAEKLAERINTDTKGAEMASGEAEINFRNLTYSCTYEIRREFNNVFYDYDTEPEPQGRAYLSIIDGIVRNADGEPVTSDFDFTAVEDFFDFDATFLTE